MVKRLAWIYKPVSFRSWKNNCCWVEISEDTNWRFFLHPSWRWCTRKRSMILILDLNKINIHLFHQPYQNHCLSLSHSSVLSFSHFFHSIYPAELLDVTVLFHNLTPSYLWPTSRSYIFHFIIHALVTQSFYSFSKHANTVWQVVKIAFTFLCFNCYIQLRQFL